MPDRFISVFGTYDFLGKVLPGMTIVIGGVALLPSGIVPSVNVAENFLILLSILVIIGLIGALIGEFVHSLANIFERIVGWVLRLGWKIIGVGSDSSNTSDPGLLVNEVGFEGTENGNEEVDDQDQTSSELPQNCVNWFNSQIEKIAYVVWPHRKIFLRRIKVIGSDDFRLDRSINDAGFAEEYFIKEKLVRDYGVETPEDMNQIYSVVVSTLAENNYDRAFRFQARYSFCRSMWMVLTLLAATYFYTTLTPPVFIPSELIYEPYISRLLDSVIIYLSGSLLLISLVFAFASGSYKKYYIDYLIV